MIRRYLNIFISLLLLSLPFYYPSPAEGKWAQNGATVPVGATASRMYPSITATGNGSGSAFVAWEDLSVTPGDIYIQKIDINGTPLFDSDKDATVDNAASKQYPAVAGDGSGGAFVVWEDSRNGNTDIYIQKIDGSGNLAWSEDKAVCTASGTQWNPRLALTSDGDVIVAWEDHRSSVFQIYTQRIDKTSGNPVWTLNGITVSAASGNQFSPAVSSDGYDGAVVVWEDQRDLSTTGSDIYVQRIDSSGAGQWGSAETVATNAAGDQWFPAIATDGQNSFIITWEDYRMDGIFSDVYAKGVDNGGLTLFGDKEVCSINIPERKDVRHPVVAYSTNEDSFIIAWEDYRSDPNYTSDIYAQRINYAGTLAWASNGIAVSTENDYQEALSITSSDGRGVITAWQNFRSGTDYGIYSLPLPVPGSITIDADAASTTEATVDLALSATGLANTITQMRLRNDNPDWANDSDGWETYFTTKTGWSITDTEGARKVYVQFKDGDGNISPAYFDDIALSYIPTGSVTITEVYNSGTAGYTDSTSVNLVISATNAAQMCISNAMTCSTWETYATSKAWTLTSGDGQKTVYIQFQDQYGNISSTYYSDTIILDTTGPSGTSLTITSPITTKDGITYTNSATVTLSVLADDGSGSGVSNMNFSNNNTTSWGNESVYANTREWNLNFKSSGDGLKKVYAKFRDNLVNYGGATVSNSVILDTTPPTGSISINSGATYTTSATVNLTISASDTGSNISQMCVSNSASCTTWESYNTSKSWTLSTGDGTKSVYVQINDVAGNIATYSANIILDTTGPAGSIVINNGDTYANSTAVNLTLSANDNLSSVVSMCVSNTTTCSAWETYETSKSWIIPAGDETKTVYVQFKDSLGNVSSSFNSTIILDTASPAGSILINAGASYINTISATLNISASDSLSGTAYMRFSNDNSNWTSWETYAATENWMLPSGDGQKTVYAQFKDTAGNTSATISDDISLETSQPSSAISSPSSNARINGTSHTITGTASDTGSGVSKVEVSTDGGSTWSNATGTTSWTYSWTLPADGSYTVNTRATDVAGNIETVGAGITVTVDNTAPLTTAAPEGGNYNSSQSVALSTSETATIYYTTDGSAPTTSSSQYTAAISITGTTTLKYLAVDAAGNTEAVKTQVYNIDTVVPSTTASPAGGLYKSAQSVTLTSSKPTESAIYYTTDGSAPTTSSTAYASPIAISSTTTLKFFARDIYGNQESVNTQVYTIDMTGPTGSVTINSGDAYTASASVTLTLSAADASGVSQMQFSSNNTDWSSAEAYATSKAWTLATGDGTKTVYVKFRDNAGNWSSSYSDTIVLDTATPETTATPSGGNYNSSQSVTLSANETATIYYTMDGSAPTTGSSQYASEISVTGTTTLKYLAVDAAGNTETVKTQVYNIDTVVPSTTASPAGGLYNSAQSVTLTSSKPTESTIYYTTDGSAPTTSSAAYASPIAISSTTTLKFFARDIYGNQESVNTQVYTIDGTAPTGSVTINSGDAYTASASVTLTLSAADASGVSQMQFSSNNTEWSSAEAYATSKAWTLATGDGAKTVYVKFRDNAGNWSSSYSDTITLDTAAPVTTATPSGGNYNSSQSVALSANETATIYYTTDGSAPTTSSSQYASAISITGTTTLKYFALDAAGNSETVKTQVYNIDTVVPSTTASPAGGLYNTAQSVTLTSSKPGESTIYYTTDGSAPTTSSNAYASPIAISSTTTLKFFARDIYGNQESVNTQVYTIDTATPSSSVSSPSGGSRINGTSYTITGTASDTGSGVSRVEVSTDGGSTWNNATGTAPWTYSWTLPADGSYTINTRATDAAGNIEAVGTGITAIVDNTAPAGALVINSGAAYTTMADAALTLSGDADISQMQFSNDNAAWSTPEAYNASKSWTLSSGDETKTVYARFVDTTGNWSTIEIKDTIILDTTGSTGSITIDSGAVYAASSNVILTVSASDPNGVDQMQFSDDNSSWSEWESYSSTKEWTLTAGDGLKTVYARFKDMPGNISQSYSDDIVMDATLPTGSITINSDATYANTTSITLTISCTDSGSGCSQMQFSNDNLTWSTPEGYAVAKTWDLSSTEGTKTVYAKFKDNAGNWNTSEIKDTISLDTTPPSVGSTVPVNGATGISADSSISLIFTETVANASSSILLKQGETIIDSTVTYDDSAKTATITPSASLSEYSAYAVIVTTGIRDIAANPMTASYAFSFTTADITKPSSTISTPSDGAIIGNAGSYNITGNASDTGSGVFNVEVSTDGGSTWNLATGTSSWTYNWTLPADGSYTIKARATDAEGNLEVAGTGITVTVDNTPPTGTVSINDGATYTNSTGVVLTLSVNDPSGISEMQFSNNNSSWSTQEAYAATKAWTLAAGDGLKTVYARLKDNAGNWSFAEIKATITLDTTILTGSIIINSDAEYTNTSDVTLTISGSNDVSEMQFSNDNLTWSTPEAYATTSIWTLDAGDGLRTVYARFRDNAGNVSSSFSDSITLDATAPISSISAPSSGVKMNGNSYIITGTALDSASGVLKVEVSTNGGTDWSEAGGTTSWTYAWTITDDGTYTIKTRATDAAGNVEAAGTGKTVTVDNVAPTGSVAINGGAAYTNTLDVTLTISVSDAGSGAAKMQYGEALKGDWETYSESASATLHSGEETKTIYIQFMDAAGNTSEIYSDTIILDASAPAVNIISPASGITNNATPTLTYTVSDGTAVVFVDDMEVPNISGSNIDPLSDGSHTITVDATDLAGNTGSSEVTITVDTAAPETSITSQPANPSNSTSAEFIFSSTETGSTFECRMDDGGYSTCTSPKSYSDIAIGSHTFEVRATDIAGNTDNTPASYSWTIDPDAPTLTISSVTTPTNTSTQTITGIVEEGASVYVTTDTAASDGTATVTGGNWSYAITGLVEGVNNITATATDAASNIVTITSAITLDTAFPDTSITSQPADPSNSASADFVFTSTETGSTFECRLDGSGYAGCASPKSYTGLAEGSHTFDVRAMDGAGNTDPSPASYSWVISTTPPALTIDAVTTPTTATSQTITGIVETGASVYVTTDTTASDGAATVTGENWSYTVTGLVEGVNNITVTASNIAGNSTTITTGITLDTTPPEPQGTSPAVTLDGLVVVPGQTNPSYSYSNFTASWPSYSDSADTIEYEVALGDSAGGTNVKNWTSVGTETSVSTGDLQSLFETYKNTNGEYFGKIFYLNVKAIDTSGNESTVLSVSFVYTPAEINSKAGDRDGTVDGFDLGMLGIAYDPFGSVPSGYEAADINMDGKVDNDDLFILAVNFGKVRQ